MSIIYRYGVSLLSRKNHVVAEPEELMIDKETGQILLKQENSKIISYDAMTRFNTSLNAIQATAEQQMFLGKILSVIPDNTTLPKCITSGDQILVSEVVNLGPVKKMLIQLDVDVISTVSTFGDIKESDTVVAEIVINRNGTEQTIVEPVVHLNKKVLSFDSTQETAITSIKISNTDDTDNAESQYILQNILLLTL